MSETLKTATVPAGEPEKAVPLPNVASTAQPQYFCLLTDAGAALEAAAHAAGKPVRLTIVAMGDGNGSMPVPSEKATKLVHEVYQKPVDSISRDDEDPHIAWIHVVIPADVGGFWIREFGVYAEPLEDGGDRVLFAYGNHAPYYKVRRLLGQAITHELSIPLIMSSTADVEIVIAEAGYASRRELLHLSGIVESLRNPKEAVWTLSAAIAENGVLTLPSGIAYMPGKHLVDLSWDGIICHPGKQFAEVPVAGTLESNKLKLLFAAPAGSEFRVLVRGYSTQPILPDEDVSAGNSTRISALEQSMNMVMDGAAWINAPENQPST